MHLGTFQQTSLLAWELGAWEKPGREIQDVNLCISVSNCVRQYLLYADDTTSFSTIHITAGATHEINSHLLEVYDWLAVNKLSLDIKKN